MAVPKKKSSKKIYFNKLVLKTNLFVTEYKAQSCNKLPYFNKIVIDTQLYKI